MSFLTVPFRLKEELYSRVSHIRNSIFGFILLFYNNSLLFYPLLSQKLSVLVSYKVVSYMRDSTVVLSLTYF